MRDAHADLTIAGYLGAVSLPFLPPAEAAERRQQKRTADAPCDHWQDGGGAAGAGG